MAFNLAQSVFTEQFSRLADGSRVTITRKKWIQVTSLVFVGLFVNIRFDFKKQCGSGPFGPDCAALMPCALVSAELENNHYSRHGNSNPAPMDRRSQRT